MLLLEASDQILRPDPSNISSGDPGETLGGYLVAALIVLLQGFIGFPALLFLDHGRLGLRSFLGVAVVMSLLISAWIGSALRAPHLGESFGFMFSMALAFLGPPLLLSFWMAYALRPKRTAVS
ncbi:hypothetical protein OJ996_23325 [Luteolibacter sp. GHJ8]|uniref:Uncharacterized protein n=1 Tax=Luteolibacter rhizosphaerae TaxID=2989719 RepID=A0ABT3G9L9_9BACT|nr:hypothetical protein [Luteolibacter rhizosphaerae]MCW1916538.1 hypothetical protein [Luteolibacter rhizosphaerae]